MSGSWEPGVFERLYARDPDPWNFETSAYERDKYADTLALLPCGRRFASALELGCSIGVFTSQLAQRCDSLMALDVAERALQQARLRCRDLPQVRLLRRHLPAGFPPGDHDLIVAAEILYFLSEADIGELAARIGAALRPGGLVLLANWTGATDTPTSGERAAELCVDRLARRCRSVTCQRRPLYRLDLLEALPQR